MSRRLALAASLACLVACESKAPTAPEPPPVPTGPNRAPEVVATFTPSSGVEELTTYTVNMQVTDPDGDPVALMYRRCDLVPNDTPLQLTNGAATLSFKSSRRCRASLVLTAVDARGAQTRTFASADFLGLSGNWRLVIGEGYYTRPSFYLNLTQSEHSVLGAIHDGSDTGAIDASDPGRVEEDGQFRLRFSLLSEPAGLVLTGRLIAPSGDAFTANVIATGQVTTGRYAGRGFQIWHQSSY